MQAVLMFNVHLHRVVMSCVDVLLTAVVAKYYLCGSDT